MSFSCKNKNGNIQLINWEYIKRAWLSAITICLQGSYVTTKQKPASEFIQNGTFLSESGLLINLDDYFDITNSIEAYRGKTGDGFHVPLDWNFAIWIDSSGNITQEAVIPGTVVYFKSEVIGGTAKYYCCDLKKGCIPCEDQNLWQDRDDGVRNCAEMNCQLTYECDRVAGCVEYGYVREFGFGFSDYDISLEACEDKCRIGTICDPFVGCLSGYTNLWLGRYTGGNTECQEDCCYGTESGHGTWSKKHLSCSPSCNPSVCELLNCPADEHRCIYCYNFPGFNRCACYNTIDLDDPTLCKCSEEDLGLEGDPALSGACTGTCWIANIRTAAPQTWCDCLALGLNPSGLNFDPNPCRDCGQCEYLYVYPTTTTEGPTTLPPNPPDEVILGWNLVSNSCGIGCGCPPSPLHPQGTLLGNGDIRYTTWGEPCPKTANELRRCSGITTSCEEITEINGVPVLYSRLSQGRSTGNCPAPIIPGERQSFYCPDPIA